MQCASGPAFVLLVCVTALAVTWGAAAPAQIPASQASQLSTHLSSHLSNQASNHYTPGSQRKALASAETLLQGGEFDAAEVAFRQAFESVRADQGLFHEAQLPVLDRLLAINLARRDWDQFNYYLDYHRALSERIYQNQQVRYAEALETGADWHQSAALAMTDEHRTWHLIRARNLLWQAVSSLEQRPGHQAGLSPLLYRIAVLHYYLTTEASLRGLTSLEVRTDQPVRVSGWSMSGSEAERRSYAIGQELLERIHRQHTSDGEDNHALAHIDTLLGDWQLLFGKDALARGYYRKAYQALRADPSATQLIESLFGNTVVLPAPYFATPAGGNSLLSAMNTSEGIVRPQLTDDFFTEDHPYEFDQTSP
ncbi:MAG: hypothetical protein WD071_16660 [Pseudohongiella sp.]|uniref:hypothetical protein n=1 Tax=Pseudohongiella sp. TaxID=1979412 RepID=UPI00349FF827